MEQVTLALAMPSVRRVTPAWGPRPRSLALEVAGGHQL